MVTGVMKDLPKNSMFTFEGVIPYSFLTEIGAISNSGEIIQSLHLFFVKKESILKL